MTKYGNLGGERSLQINGYCVLHLKIGTKEKSHEVSPKRTKWEVSVCVCHASVTKSSIFKNHRRNLVESGQTLRQERKIKGPNLFPGSGI